jgi:DNA-binding protein H-NS
MKLVSTLGVLKIKYLINKTKKLDFKIKIQKERQQDKRPTKYKSRTTNKEGKPQKTGILPFASQSIK